MVWWVIAGSAIGGALRYLISGVIALQFGETFPWGTLLVNVTGSFVIGFFATLTAPDGRVLASPETRQSNQPKARANLPPWSIYRRRFELCAFC